MKTLRYIAAALFVFVLATSVTAEARRGSPQFASGRNNRVQSIRDSLVEDGYKLQGVSEQPIYYFVPPKAPYLWGTILYTYSRTAENGSIDQVELSVSLQYNETGYAFPEITVRERLGE